MSSTNSNYKDTYIYNQKETAEIPGKQNEEEQFGEFNTNRAY